MEAKPNKYITVAYKLYAVEDGENEFIEEANAEHPFQFISGLGTSLEAFEKEVAHLNKGDKFEFTIPYAEAYGEYNEEFVLDLSKDMFMIDGRFDSEMIQEGRPVPLMDADGNRMTGYVVEVKPDVVVMDMNHPLAGADLLFIGEVVENREATAEEIQGMVNLMTSEGCDCGSCGGGCDDGCDGCH